MIVFQNSSRSYGGGGYGLKVSIIPMETSHIHLFPFIFCPNETSHPKEGPHNYSLFQTYLNQIHFSSCPGSIKSY